MACAVAATGAWSAQAQIVVQDLSVAGVTPAALAQQIAGSGITISNVQFNRPGSTVAAGKFTGGSGIVGFADGVILSSGKASNITSTVNMAADTSFELEVPGDADLNTIAVPYETMDAIVLEFDFVPNDDRVSFEFVFASEEYNEFVGSSYNDVFGFFINGVNRALVGPNGDPVTINTVNFNQNVQLYQNNDPFNAPIRTADLGLEADGFTKVVTATATVVPNVVNHVKFAIADTSDQILDSWVLIRTGSFQTGDPVVVTKTAASPTSQTRGTNSYTITLSNSGNTARTLNEIEDFLPEGFTYIAGSSSGLTTTNPTVNGRKLVWTGPFTVPATGSLQLTFSVVVAPAPGTYYNSALARGGAPVVPSGDTAPVTVLHPNPLKWIADFQSLGVSSTSGLRSQGSPVVAPDGTVFLPALDGSNLHLLGIKPNGTLAIGFPASLGTISSDPGSSVTLTHGGRMIALGDAVYCIAYKHASVSDGNRLWRYPANPTNTLSVSRSSAAMDGAGNVYFVDDNDKLYGLSPTGTELWAPVTLPTSLAHELVSSPVIGKNGLLYVMGDDDANASVTVFALNSSTGAIVNQLQLSNNHAGGSPVVLSDGNLLVTSYDGWGYNGTLTVLSPDLAIKGQWSDGTGIKATPIIGSGNTVFLGTEGGSLYKLQLSYDGNGAATLTPVWTYQHQTQQPFDAPAVLSSEGLVVCADVGGSVHFIKDLGSSFLAETPYSTNGQGYSSPALAPDGTIYVNSHLIGLHAFAGRDAGEPRTWSSWRNGRCGRADALDLSPQAISLPIPPLFEITRFVNPANPTSGFGSGYSQVYTVNNNQSAFGMGNGGPHDGVFELYQGAFYDLGVLSSSSTPVIARANDRHYGVGYSWDGVTRDGVNNVRYFPLWYHRGASPSSLSPNDSTPAAVNVQGVVCGQLKTGTIVQALPGQRLRVVQYATKPAVWEAGASTLLPDSTAAYYHSYAFDINRAGSVCGFTDAPIVWTKAANGYVAQYLPNSVGGNIQPKAINDSGVIVGWGIVNSTTYGSVWIPDSSGQYAQYLHVGCQFEDINNFGVLAGSYSNAASVWLPAGAAGTYSRINLKQRINNASWTALYTANTINDSNYVGGYGLFSGKTQGYILKP